MCVYFVSQNFLTFAESFCISRVKSSVKDDVYNFDIGNSDGLIG